MSKWVAGVGSAAVANRTRGRMRAPRAPAMREVELGHARGDAHRGLREAGQTNSRDPRHFNIIEGGRVYQALHIDSKSVLDAPYRLKKCLRRSM